MLKYWFVTTDHLEDRLLFKDVEDFCVGMNYVAVQAHKWKVSVLVFILMSNHLHFVLLCTREQAEEFINGFKKEYSKYLRIKYGSKEHLRRNGVDIRQIPTENEVLERTLAYVQMNCVAANICCSPGDYPWGTGSCFFIGPMEDLPKATVLSGGRPLAGFSKRERYRLIHSKIELPGEWPMADAGYVLPSAYVRKDLVEKIFRTPKRYNYFLRSSSKARVKLEAGEQSRPTFKDQVIASALPDLCSSLFRKQQVKELSDEQMVELMHQLCFRFAANAHQLARVMGLTYEQAAAYMDRV